MQQAHAASDPRKETRLVALAVITLALLPLPLGIIIWSTPGGGDDPNLRVSASPYDIPLLLLVVLLLPEMVRRCRRLWAEGTRWPLAVGAAAAGWFLLASAVHPNWRAVELAFHAIGGAAVAYLLGTRRRETVVKLALAITMVAALQAVLGTWQSLAGKLLGLGGLEASTRLWQVGNSHAGRGSFLHPYHLTTFLMLGLAATFVLRRLAPDDRYRHTTTIATVLLGVGIPLTFSRAALLALVVIVPIGLIGRERALTVVLLLSLAGGIALGASGWEQRGETTGDPSAVDSGRSSRLSEAEELFRSEPLWGVGPGGYGIALEERSPSKLLPAHNAVAHFGAEAGVLGGVIVILGILTLAALSGRAGTLGMIAGASVVNFHLLDAFPHVYPNGIVISGAWIGLVLLARRIARCDPRLAEAEPTADESVSRLRPSPAGGP